MKKRLTVCILSMIMIVTLTSCTVLQSILKPEWDVLTEELFVSSMVEDTLSMRFYIEDPVKFGIHEYEETLGSLVEIEGDTWASDALKTLNLYDKKDLTQEQQLEYEVLYWFLLNEASVEKMDYYQELAAPTYGIQANYPINMANYSIEDEADIQSYFALLKDTSRYMDELLDYEIQRADKGFCMTDAQLDTMLAECEAFIEGATEENVMAVTFAERLEALELDPEAESAYIDENEKLLEEYVIASYETFMDGMEVLKEKNSGSGSLAEYPEGKKYYEYLARTASSSNRTVPEMKSLLQRYLKRNMTEMYSIIQENYELIDQIENADYGAETPNEILDMISARMEQILPPIETEYTIRYVPQALQKSLPPAFCYVPQIDDIESVMYFNQNPEYENMDFYITVAHEGYPGHMYQNTYFYQQEPAWFRCILPFTGYKEGWACYISYKALALSDLEDEELQKLIMLNEAIGYELSALADIGVNYEGWSVAELCDFFRSYGYELTDEEAEEQYNMLMNSPAGYMSYSVSCCEIWELESYAKMKLKNQYDEKEFHQVILDAGPVPFSILQEQLDAYILTKK